MSRRPVCDRSAGKSDRVRELLTKLEQASALDRVGDRLQRVVQATLRPQRVRDALHGVWLGHPLHPALVQVPVGAWISAAVVDLLPGPAPRRHRAGRSRHGQRRARRA